MKKLIYISGIVAVNLMMIGAFCKAMHWPGANIILILAIFIFCILFLPSALISSFKTQEVKKYKWLYIVTFIVFFINLAGALFKVLHWQGAGLILIVALPLPFVLFLPVYLAQTRKDKNYSVLNLMGVMFGLTFVAVFSVLLALNVSRDVLMNISSDIVRVKNATEYNNSRSADLKDIDGIKQKADDVCKFIDAMKNEMLAMTGNQQTGPLDPFNLNGMDNSEASSFVLTGKNEKGDLPVLKEKILEFRKTILDSPKASEDLKNLAKELLVPSGENEAPDYEYVWEKREFPTNHLIAVIDGLTRLQNNIRFVEAEFLAGRE